MDLAMNAVAVVVAVLALIVSIASWRTSKHAVRASIFDRRYEVYSDAERFLGGWMREGRPDMTLLPVLTGAWSRSHFLCSEDVTKYLRKVWLDAIESNRLQRIISGQARGNRDEAIERESVLLEEHTNFDKLRAVFITDLRVEHPTRLWTW